MVAENYNLNVTEVRDSDFKNAFSRNFQLHRRDPMTTIWNFPSGRRAQVNVMILKVVGQLVIKLTSLHAS